MGWEAENIYNLLLNFPSQWNGKKLIFMSGLMKVKLYPETVYVKRIRIGRGTLIDVFNPKSYIYNRIRGLVIRHLKYHGVA